MAPSSFFLLPFPFALPPSSFSFGRAKDEFHSRVVSVPRKKFLIVRVGPFVHQGAVAGFEYGVVASQVVEEAALGLAPRFQPELV
jgi:hypothetical protein